MTATSDTAVDAVLTHLNADTPRYLPLVPGRTELDLAITLDSGNHYLHCCTGAETPSDIRFTAPNELQHIDYIAVVTDTDTYIVDPSGLDTDRDTIVSPDGNGVTPIQTWLAAHTAETNR